MVHFAEEMFAELIFAFQENKLDFVELRFCRINICNFCGTDIKISKHHKTKYHKSAKKNDY